MQLIVTGIPELKARIAQLGGSIVGAATPASKAGAEIVERASKSLVPVDSGRLRDSIQTTTVGPGIAEVSTDVDYAGFVEFGTYKDAPQPFMGPAADAGKTGAIAAMTAIFRKAVGLFG